MNGIALARRVTPRPVKLVFRRLLRRPPAVAAPSMETPGLPQQSHLDLTNTGAVRAFVARSDELGGPDAPSTIAWWGTLVCDVSSDMRSEAEGLDPLSLPPISRCKTTCTAP